MSLEMGLKCREASAGLSAASEGEETDGLVDSSVEKLAANHRMHRRVRISLGVMAVTAIIALVTHSLKREMDSRQLHIASWNIAAINNNPFEYWITHDDSEYGALMDHVQEFIDTPGDRDVPVGDVFTPQRWQELKALMQAEGWAGVEATEQRWLSDFKERKIITGFLKDKLLGEKRLASMPDRVTNTINTLSQGVLYRPTVINCFGGDLSNLRKWWREWKTFMFNGTLRLQGSSSAATTPAQMLQPIKKSKYPAISDEEAAISIPLQTLAQAIFDAVLVHIVNEVSPTGKWQVLRGQMCDALNKRKDERTAQILATTYAREDIIFLQEAAAAFLTRARDSELGSRYILGHAASLDGKRDQNSLVLLRKDLFLEETVEEHTSLVMSSFTKDVPVANGDLLVLSVDDTLGRQYLLASFHGDTNGLATKPVLAAVHALAQTMPQRRLIFGLDANTYERGTVDSKGVPTKQDVLDFAADYVSKGYSSCWGDTPDPKNHTTFNARTFLQAQLQKAARSTEKRTKGDKNPKDFILFPKSIYAVVATVKDNTGVGRYIEEMVFPTLDFPSDHGVLSTTLELQ